jgi:hypothetical protein
MALNKVVERKADNVKLTVTRVDEGCRMQAINCNTGDVSVLTPCFLDLSDRMIEKLFEDDITITSNTDVAVTIKLKEYGKLVDLK